MMDAFDAEPWLDLLPRRIQRGLARILIAVLVIVPAATPWLIAQAQTHIEHEIQPLVEKLISSVPTSFTIPTTTTPPDDAPGSVVTFGSADQVGRWSQLRGSGNEDLRSTITALP
jgi:hypothetical protein